MFLKLIRAASEAQMIGEISSCFTLNSGVMWECKLCGIPTVTSITRAFPHGSALTMEGICQNCGHPYKKELFFELIDKGEK